MLENLYIELPTVDTATYSLLTFGSLILLIAGIYLPQIIKLKIAGIELEKSNLENVPIDTLQNILLENPNLSVIIAAAPSN